ncbi:inorganic diphosphatase [Comamonas sp. JC664]|uniref:inorganic diphosphatase n=1 Tax=Comamonas sp. JC664 TaxID=2801917 RepID=UPI00174E25AE|nr:inorganic diphosphatase [Comamonas sp. JC664]MBL0693880.1 inorganic diphosphatase [Comamonas sp. JC664]GHG74939.1 inorganic pyrophosphatase [Comamonas sp. KCTC 72670]
MDERLWLPPLPDAPEVLIECPRFSFVKRRADGAVDFISPLPCPYNYGSIPGLTSDEGDPLDAVVLGPRLALGQRLKVPVVGVIGFVDAGRGDPKVVCSAAPLTNAERAGLERFFRVYALFKQALHRVRGNAPDTRFAGWLPLPAPVVVTLGEDTGAGATGRRAP